MTGIKKVYKSIALIEILYVFIGGNLSEERLSPIAIEDRYIPYSKDFNTDLSLIGFYPIRLKLNTKVLGKEFEK